MINTLHDSGTRRQFSTGAVRDCAEGKGRTDLYQVFALMRLARHLERGAKKYNDRNWEKGIPVSKFLDSGIRHALEALSGLDDEDHLAAALWNFACAIDTLERVNLHILPSELDDLPKPLKGFKKVNPEEIKEDSDFAYYDTAFGTLSETKDHLFKRTEGIGENEMEIEACGFKIKCDPHLPPDSIGLHKAWEKAVNAIECVTEIPFCTLLLNKETLQSYDLLKYFAESNIHFKGLDFKVCQGYQDGVVVIDTGKPQEQQTLWVPAKYKLNSVEKCVGNCEGCSAGLAECLRLNDKGEDGI
ncbi:MAG: dATP/dGTP diphosphohydrolase domain-containing protein [Syntrophomonadaceae bacterium]